MSKIVQRLLRVDCALSFFDLGSSVSKLGTGGDGVNRTFPQLEARIMPTTLLGQQFIL